MYLFKCAVRKFKTPCRAPIGSASPGRVGQHWAGGPGGASSAIAGALPSEGGPAPCPAHVACTHAYTFHGARFSSPCQYDLFWDSLPLKRKEKQSWNAASSVSRLPLTSSGSHCPSPSSGLGCLGGRGCVHRLCVHGTRAQRSFTFE